MRNSYRGQPSGLVLPTIQASSSGVIQTESPTGSNYSATSSKTAMSQVYFDKPEDVPHDEKRPLGVPETAFPILFQAHNGKWAQYYQWSVWIGDIAKGEDRIRKYYWYALGHFGESASGFMSGIDARAWIANGLAGIKR